MHADYMRGLAVLRQEASREIDRAQLGGCPDDRLLDAWQELLALRDTACRAYADNETRADAGAAAAEAAAAGTGAAGTGAGEPDGPDSFGVSRSRPGPGAPVARN